MPTENRQVSFLAGETDDPDDTRSVGQARAEARRRWRRPRRPLVGTTLQAVSLGLMVYGSWWVAGIGVAAIVGAVILGTAGVLIEMGRM